ncbi:hypothetical protein CYMTET_28640 [Cymbomonas tetramitiformis]|uniref:glutathione transferase n=1 Tax=Cymbomonas tetramitiformis TaxID=36881 RepID=A0AAE0FMQ8_9CHLO|nr:hypothetical protein CYMTET_28640 [Cymbomonas tetramitiformis]
MDTKPSETFSLKYPEDDRLPDEAKRVTIGYWDHRGLGQVVRLTLAYLEIPFEDKRYKVGDPPNFDKAVWAEDKYNLGLALPNLPYVLIPEGVCGPDGDLASKPSVRSVSFPLKLTQTYAILRFFARTHDLLGATEPERTRADMLVESMRDIQDALFQVIP